MASKPKAKKPDPPKRPLTTYQRFLNEVRPRYQEQGYTFGQIAQLVSAEWKKMTVADKAKWQQMYDEDKERYEEEMDAYAMAGYNRK